VTDIRIRIQVLNWHFNFDQKKVNLTSSKGHFDTFLFNTDERRTEQNM
jgi:hypothetical protein